MDRKDIFMSGFKSKISYSFTYKDLAEFEAIIDFYEQQVKKQKEIINEAIKKVDVLRRKYAKNVSPIPCTEIEDIDRALKEVSE